MFKDDLKTFYGPESCQWLINEIKYMHQIKTKLLQITSTCSKSTIRTLEKSVKYVQS